jgi:DNA-binding transcriptional LysR family regulator
MQIDLVQLRTFVAVAEEQHLTRAAEQLHISQSAANAHVRAVEERLDTQLFVRTNRSLELMRAGQLLLDKAKILLNEAAVFMSFAREIRGKIEGHLVVGASSEPATTRQGLKTGEFDIGLILGRPIDPGFTYYELTKVQFRVAGPSAWREKIESAN